MSSLAPPVNVRSGPVTWARRNLFATWYDAALTVVFGAVGLVAARNAARFVFSSGRWDIIRDGATNLLVGLYPRDQLWRVWALAFVATFVGAYVGGRTGRPADVAALVRRTWPVVLLAGVFLVLAPSMEGTVAIAAIVPVGAAGRALALRTTARRRPADVVVAVAAASGFVLATAGAGWDRWGGLLLTLFLAAAGIVCSFPLGVLLALGRRSSLPAVRVASVVYIEAVRGVPLITLLFMGSFVVGLLFPPGFERPSLVTRALIAIVAFTAAYIAEIVRGGLQSVPAGQAEAAWALGLSRTATLRRIVLPQALRAVIPAMVGQFISLFKDTSLVAIIGLSELLRTGQGLTSQPRFLAQGLQAEVLVTVSFIYWVGAYTMSKESQRLEERLGVGRR